MFVSISLYLTSVRARIHAHAHTQQTQIAACHVKCDAGALDQSVVGKIHAVDPGFVDIQKAKWSRCTHMRTRTHTETHAGRTQEAKAKRFRRTLAPRSHLAATSWC